MRTVSRIQSSFPRLVVTCAALSLCTASSSAQAPRFGRLHEMIGAAKPSKVAALGDVDLDGDVDLLLHHGPADKGLFLNVGGGRFVLAANQPDFGHQRTHSMALGDVDGDQDLDLLIGNGDEVIGGGDVQLRLNDGSGNFLVAPFPTGYTTTMAVAFGDTDGDGDLDAIAGNGADWDLWPSGLPAQLFLNDGAGVFSEAPAQMPTLSCDTQALVLVDVDGDQDLDLVLATGGNYFASQQPSRLYLNDGNSNFSDATHRFPPHVDQALDVVAGDVDGDSDVDLIFGNLAAPRLYTNDGAGVFTDASAQLPASITRTVGLALRDFDGDGDLDLLGSSAYNDEFLSINDGNGVFTNAPSADLPDVAGGSARTAVADLDGDQDFDCLFLGEPNPDRLRFNDGSGKFLPGPAQVPGSAADGYRVVTGDLDSDSDLDLVLGSHVLINDGTGWFAGSDVPGVDGGSVVLLTLGDVDRDLDLDLFLGGYGNEQVFLNDGAGAFSAAPVQLPANNDTTYAIAVADVDLDGDLDALMANSPSQSRLLVNDGAGVFSDATAQLPQGVFSTTGALFADFDGDGDPDLLLENLGQKALLYLNDGTGQFIDASAGYPDALTESWLNLAGDLDLDGDLDVLSLGPHSTQDRQVRLYENDGTAVFLDVQAAVPALSWSFVDAELSDVDGDGDLDAILMGKLWAQFLINDGSGVFELFSPPSTPVGPGGELAIGDFDLDGDEDAFLGFYSPGASWFLSNLRSHLAWREVPRVGKPLTIDLYGTPGGGWVLIGARPHAQTPFPPYGLLQLRRGSAFVITQGPFDTDGRASVVIPPLPSLVGATFYLQALIGSPRVLTNVEPVTLTGF